MKKFQQSGMVHFTNHKDNKNDNNRNNKTIANILNLPLYLILMRTENILPKIRNESNMFTPDLTVVVHAFNSSTWESEASRSQ